MTLFLDGEYVTRNQRKTLNPAQNRRTEYAGIAYCAYSTANNKMGITIMGACINKGNGTGSKKQAPGRQVPGNGSSAVSQESNQLRDESR